MFRRCCVTVCFAVGRSQAVKAAGFDPAIPGSNPGAPANRYDQMVVRGPVRRGGSSSAAPLQVIDRRDRPRKEGLLAALGLPFAPT